MAQYEFDKLFVESSGLGDPSNVEEILKASEMVSGRSYDFRGVICFVDSVNFLSQLEDLETVHRQLKHCHLAVITKTDLVSEEEVQNLCKVIRTINPVCKIVESANRDLDITVLEEDLLLYQWAEGEETTIRKKQNQKPCLWNLSRKWKRKDCVLFWKRLHQAYTEQKDLSNLREKAGIRLTW